MEVLIKRRSENLYEKMDYRDKIEIYIDGEKVFRVYDGEPEDNNLERNFGDCYDVDGLMRRAFDAGKAGEKFIVKHKEIMDEDL